MGDEVVDSPAMVAGPCQMESTDLSEQFAFNKEIVLNRSECNTEKFFITSQRLRCFGDFFLYQTLNCAYLEFYTMLRASTEL